MKIHTSFASLSSLKNPVVTIGTFDGVHRGHLSILNTINSIASDVNGESVLLTFYPHPRMVLHPEDHNIRMLNTPEEKAEHLEKAGIDHLVVHPFSKEFSRLSPFEYVRDLLVTGLNAHTVVVGYDHRFGRNREGDHDTLVELSETFGFGVREIPAMVIDDNSVSSTKIRNALQIGDVEAANHALGYNYSLNGTVVRGDEIGRTLGFPTANIRVDYDYKLIPRIGIYAVRTFVGNKMYNGVMSIGVRPTINNENQLSVEVYILDFNSDIYGEKIKVELLSYLRDEMKFGSIDELKLHIAQDVSNAAKYF